MFRVLILTFFTLGNCWPANPSGSTVDNVCLTKNLQCDDDCEDPIFTPLENCAEYCLCQGGLLTHEKCSDGLHFNPNTNLCDLPENARCDVCISANITCDKECEDPVYTPLDNCGEYCLCQGGLVTHETCSDGLHFNPRTNLCDYPENAGCDVEDVCISTNITCDQECEDPIYAPLENCGEYCLCEGGVLTHEKCSDGLHFNPRTNLCDFPDIAGCEVDDVCSSANITCDEQCVDPIYASLENCGEYCVCEGGVLTHEKCSNGLHFNPRTNLCDYPENAGCQVDDVCDSANITCDEQCEDPIYAPLENCGEYCLCEGGVLTHEKCSDGLHFNPNTNLCDYPENAGCQVDDVCDSANITCDEQCEDPIYSPLKNCGEYCLCEGGILTHGKCSDGLHFNPATNLCDFPENAGCEELNPCEQYNIRCEDECEDPIYTPLNDCNQYCKCLGGVLTLETCASELLFNPNTNQCDIPENVDCSAEIYT